MYCVKFNLCSIYIMKKHEIELQVVLHIKIAPNTPHSAHSHVVHESCPISRIIIHWYTDAGGTHSDNKILNWVWEQCNCVASDEHHHYRRARAPYSFWCSRSVEVCSGRALISNAGAHFAFCSRRTHLSLSESRAVNMAKGRRETSDSHTSFTLL